MDNMDKISEAPKKKVSPEFRERLLELIDDAGCRRTEFSSLVNVNKDIISRATIYGIIPSMQSLLKIANYSEVSLEYLLGLSSKNEFCKSESPTTFHSRLLQLTAEKETTFAQIAHKCHLREIFFKSGYGEKHYQHWIIYLLWLHTLKFHPTISSVVLMIETNYPDGRSCLK